MIFYMKSAPRIKICRNEHNPEIKIISTFKELNFLEGNSQQYGKIHFSSLMLKRMTLIKTINVQDTK